MQYFINQFIHINKRLLSSPVLSVHQLAAQGEVSQVVIHLNRGESVRPLQSMYTGVVSSLLTRSGYSALILVATILKVFIQTEL